MWPALPLLLLHSIWLTKGLPTQLDILCGNLHNPLVGTFLDDVVRHCPSPKPHDDTGPTQPSLHTTGHDNEDGRNGQHDGSQPPPYDEFSREEKGGFTGPCSISVERAISVNCGWVPLLRSRIDTMKPSIVVMLGTTANLNMCADVDVGDHPDSICNLEHEEQDIHQMQRLLGPDYTVSCDAKNERDCIGVLKSVWKLKWCNENTEDTQRAIEHSGDGNLGGICYSETQFFPPECPIDDTTFSVSTVFAISVESGEEIEIVIAHPFSGHSCEYDDCTLAMLKQVYSAGAGNMRRIVIGDHGVDPFRFGELIRSANWLSSTLKTEYTPPHTLKPTSYGNLVSQIFVSKKKDSGLPDIGCKSIQLDSQKTLFHTGVFCGLYSDANKIMCVHSLTYAHQSHSKYSIHEELEVPSSPSPSRVTAYDSVIKGIIDYFLTRPLPPATNITVALPWLPSLTITFDYVMTNIIVGEGLPQFTSVMTSDNTLCLSSTQKEVTFYGIITTTAGEIVELKVQAKAELKHFCVKVCQLEDPFSCIINQGNDSDMFKQLNHTCPVSADGGVEPNPYVEISRAEVIFVEPPKITFKELNETELANAINNAIWAAPSEMLSTKIEEAISGHLTGKSLSLSELFAKDTQEHSNVDGENDSIEQNDEDGGKETSNADDNKVGLETTKAEAKSEIKHEVPSGNLIDPGGDYTFYIVVVIVVVCIIFILRIKRKRAHGA